MLQLNFTGYLAADCKISTDEKNVFFTVISNRKGENKTNEQVVLNCSCSLMALGEYLIKGKRVLISSFNWKQNYYQPENSNEVKLSLFVFVDKLELL